MALRPVDIIVCSDMDLNDVNFLSEVKAYVLVSIKSSQSYPKIQSPADGENKTNPNWNFPITFMLDEVALVNGRIQMIVEIRTDGTVKNKEIGRVTVLLGEFVKPKNDGGVQAGTIQYVTRPVYKPSGKIKGTLNFSVKIGERIGVRIPPQPMDPQVFASCMANHVYPSGPFFGPPPRPPVYPLPNMMTQPFSSVLAAVLLAEHAGSLLQMMGDGLSDGGNPAYYDGGFAYGAVLLAEHAGSLLQMMGDGLSNGGNPAYYDGDFAYGGDVGF